jgi:hydrogenase small subunit
MEYLGCKGKKTYSDCPMRRWNSSGPGQFGVNWCIGARSPCLGCVNPTFPDGMSPFYVYSPTP